MKLRWKEYEAEYEYPGRPGMKYGCTERRLQYFVPAGNGWASDVGNWVDVETVPEHTLDIECPTGEAK
jgi:hypothetical protein